MINDSLRYCSMSRDFTVHIITLHVVSAISIPIDVFCGYVILKHSPSQFGAFKWHLFIFHLFAALTDFSLSVGTIPIPFIPFIMGYPAGLLQYLGISSINQFRIVVFLFDFTIGASVVLFEYRMYKVTQPTSRLHMKPRTHKLWNTLTYLFCLLVFIGFVPGMQVDINATIAKIETNYPCLSDIAHHPGFMLIDTDEPKVYAGLALVLVALIIAIIVILIKVVITFSQLRFSVNLSEETKAIQRKLVTSLIYQVSLPFIIIMIPLFFAIYVCYYKIPNTQIFGNIILFGLSMHGTLSSLAILTMNRPYFNALKGLFFKRPEVPPAVLFSMTSNSSSSQPPIS